MAERCGPEGVAWKARPRAIRTWLARRFRRRAHSLAQDVEAALVGGDGQHHQVCVEPVDAVGRVRIVSRLLPPLPDEVHDLVLACVRVARLAVEAGRESRETRDEVRSEGIGPGHVARATRARPRVQELSDDQFRRLCLERARATSRTCWAGAFRRVECSPSPGTVESDSITHRCRHARDDPTLQEQ